MKKLIYIISTFLSITCLIGCIVLRTNHKKFNSQAVLDNIEYLSSSKFKGRQPGTKENQDVANRIAQVYKNCKLKPLSKDYIENFNVISPINNNCNCSITINDGEKIIKSLTLGRDFKEDFINFNCSNIEFTNKDKVQIYQKSIVIVHDNKSYLFYVTFDSNFSFRSSFMDKCDYEFAIQINTLTYNEILDSLRNKYSIKVNLCYKEETVSVSNVIGMINGSDKSLSPLILTAHFDHLGTDSLNTIYGGALDNASGISFLLELAKTYSSIDTPKRDIIFVALNCEEYGFLGSSNFVNKHKDILKGAQVINFDMIGAKDYPLTFMRSENSLNTSSLLEDSLEDICKSKSIKYNIIFKDSSDHVPFAKNYVDSLTISTMDTTNIHTPKDTSDKISTKSIDNVYNLINSKIFDYSYSNSILIIYNDITFYFLIICSILFIILTLKEYTK